MESTWRKLESSLDFLCEQVFRNSNDAISVSGDVYNMIFEDDFSDDDVWSFLKFCVEKTAHGAKPDFDEWYASSRSPKSK